MAKTIKRPAVGALVTVKEPVEAWYSRYMLPDKPEQWLRPGMVAVIYSSHDRGDTGAVVYFVGETPAGREGIPNRYLWQAYIQYDNLVILNDAQIPDGYHVEHSEGVTGQYARLAEDWDYLLDKHKEM